MRGALNTDIFSLLCRAQVCTIAMVMGNLDKEMVTLLPDKMWMEENVDMTLFLISDWSLEKNNVTEPTKGIKMKIVLKRKVLNELMTTYLPSILLILITWATTFFKPFFFEAALSVNLTTMLVLTTIFIGVMQTLPTTSYIKMIDVWLIFSQLVPFLEVILLTIRESYREGDGSGEGKPVERTTETTDASGNVQLEVFEGEDISTISSLGKCKTGCLPRGLWARLAAWLGSKDMINTCTFIGEIIILTHSSNPKFQIEEALNDCP